MKTVFRLLCLLCFFLNIAWSTCFAQTRANELGFELARVYFSDWGSKGLSWSAGGRYERLVKESLTLSFAFQYNYGSISSSFDDSDPANLLKPIDRNFYHTDFNVGYLLLKNKPSTISLQPYGGITYVWGSETILLIHYPSPPYAFPESIFMGVPRHNIGFVAGMKLNLLILQRFNLQPDVKFRAYTKGVSDSSFGINLGFRFSDPKLSKK